MLVLYQPRKNTQRFLLHILPSNTRYKEVSFLMALIKMMCCFRKLDVSIYCTQMKSEQNYETCLFQIISERKWQQLFIKYWVVCVCVHVNTKKCSIAFTKDKWKKCSSSGQNLPLWKKWKWIAFSERRKGSDGTITRVILFLLLQVLQLLGREQCTVYFVP